MPPLSFVLGYIYMNKLRLLSAGVPISCLLLLFGGLTPVKAAGSISACKLESVYTRYVVTGGTPNQTIQVWCAGGDPAGGGGYGVISDPVVLDGNGDYTIDYNSWENYAYYTSQCLNAGYTNLYIHYDNLGTNELGGEYLWTGNACGSPSPVCGDGVIEGGEECDDENTDDDDGCSSLCAVESGYSCIGEPSICSLLSPSLFAISDFVGGTASVAEVVSDPAVDAAPYVLAVLGVSLIVGIGMALLSRAEKKVIKRFK